MTTENLTSQVTISNAYDIISILLILAVILILLVVIIVIVVYSHWLLKKYLKLRKLKKQEKLDKKLVGGDVYAAARRESLRSRALYNERIAEEEQYRRKKSNDVVECVKHLKKICLLYFYESFFYSQNDSGSDSDAEDIDAIIALEIDEKMHTGKG